MKQMTMRLNRRSFLRTAAAGGLAAVAGPSYGDSTQAHSFGADTARKDLHTSQLFLDDTWIAEAYRLERTWESADIYPEPVVKPEAP